ncbi:muconate/chloromuconate family cycloisomerase [Rheinheimera sp. MMS21-TC3]|uniref:muconate/chloromuconate family cycloisomerase n=1 Tax=Rheinheimera sp. MMS21-TC3 TaxID=3072790 RepID=UPI0028C3BA50|nr:muconate/chloromuconate family cycloisomerase [Rheinheimera sp. MMS21-TC3]WNO60644.1 muconate/chloromuconate family cycloisomerase [Rheinheimera sp. MMS21-TC3]
MISAIETILIDIPTIRPHKLSVATMNTQTLVLVKISTEDGLVGWGEATTIGGLKYGDESPESVRVNIQQHISPLLLQQDEKRVGGLMNRLRKQIRGNRFAKCAIETALLDINSQRLGVPMSELLGGRLRDSVPVLWTLASGDTANDIAEAQMMLDLRRHNSFKLKIGLNSIQEDVRHVLAIKKALGDDVSIRVDVNQAWSELQATTAIAQLQDGGIDLIEQPLKAENRRGMARLTERFSVAIMADETLNGPQDAWDVAQQNAADVFAVKIAQSGGLTQAKELATIARLSGISLYGGTMLEGAIGTIASAQLFATFEELTFGTELFGPLLLTQDILTEPLKYHDFALELPTGKGLGLAIDTDKIAAWRRQD